MRALLFDFGGTLDGPSHWLDRFVRHYNANGFPLSRTGLDSAFSYATRKGYENRGHLRRAGLETLVNYLVEQQLDHLEALSSGNSCAAPRGRAAARAIVAGFIAESRAALADSRPLLDALRQDYRIGVVSNFYGNLDVVLKEAGFQGLAIADSCALDVFKPDSRIFRAALTMLAATADDTLMIGDSLDKDCAPARALGMKSVWLRHANARKSDASAHPDFTIERLEELPELLCRMT